MNLELIKKLLSQGEGLHVEYKKCRTELPTNIFETICAFLNHDGGDIILGVDDTGAIMGIDKETFLSIKTNIVNLSNNPQKLSPPYILFPTEYVIDGKLILHVSVPSSSQVHKTNNVVFNRSNDGDFRVTETQQIADLYNTKRTHYTEGTIYSAIQFSDFEQEIFARVRSLMKSNNANHPWLALSDEEMLKKAGLWRKDFQSGREGYTLASVLLFGKDEVIQQILPHYKTDALVRENNVERYDDREYVQSNLITAYKELMNFVEKNLPDKFYLDGDQRKSLRTIIFREIIANLLVHREYTNAYPAKLVIYSDRLETENANNPHGKGALSVTHFTPFPKNPLLAKFFIQLGWVDELGSGIMNVTKFIKQYSGRENPQFIEGDVFKVRIPDRKSVV